MRVRYSTGEFVKQKGPGLPIKSPFSPFVIHSDRFSVTDCQTCLLSSFVERFSGFLRLDAPEYSKRNSGIFIEEEVRCLGIFIRESVPWISLLVALVRSR